MRSIIMFLGILALLCGRSAAQVRLTGSIDGNTVHYKITGLKGGESYKITIQHDRKNGQSSSSTRKADKNGTVKGSGTPGNDKIKPGDSVTVSVEDSKGRQIKSKSFEKPVPKEGEQSFLDLIPVLGWLVRLAKALGV